MLSEALITTIKKINGLHSTVTKEKEMDQFLLGPSQLVLNEMDKMLIWLALAISFISKTLISVCILEGRDLGGLQYNCKGSVNINYIYLYK